ncbi:MAG: ABC transporter ATP-binding protein [Acidimicrobiia bacterium]|nr:ABC transporter ATP-binding protein [Acidimicrobiia bacterium]
MTAAISTHALTKRYGDLVAVDHVDLEVETGEVFGFLGPNGAGKSTTIRCLLDLARPTSGRAEVLGFDSRGDATEIHRRVGYLPGDLALYPKLTGRDLLEYFANLRGGVDPGAIDDLAERFGADLSRRCGEYSSGNRQKVGLILAFMHNPELVILDEPSAGLDPLVQQALHELLREIRDEGRTVFLSSHTLSEVERVADRVGVIRHGRLVEVAAVADLKAMAIRRLDLEFAGDIDPERLRAIEGVRKVTGAGRQWSVAYEGSLEAILGEATRLGVVNLQSHDADLEEIFLAYYRDPDTDTAEQTHAAV